MRAPFATYFLWVSMIALMGCNDIKKSNQILSDTQEEMHAMRLEIAAMREPMQSMSESVGDFSKSTAPLIQDTQRTLLAVNQLLTTIPPEKIAETLSTVNSFSIQFAKLNESLAGISGLTSSLTPEKVTQSLDQFTAMATDFRRVNETMAQLSTLLGTLSPEKMSTALDNFNAMAEDFKKMNETTSKLAEFVSTFDPQKLASSLDQLSEVSDQFGVALSTLKDTNANIQGFTQISTVSFAMLFKMIHAVGFVSDEQASDYTTMVVNFMEQMVPVADRAQAENQANIERVRQIMTLMPEQKLSMAGIQRELENLNASIAPFKELVSIFQDMKKSGEFASLIQSMKDLSSMRGALNSMTGQMETLNTKFGSIDKISRNFPRITEVSMILGILMTCNTIEIFNATAIVSSKKSLPPMCTDYTYSQRISRLYTLISEMR